MFLFYRSKSLACLIVYALIVSTFAYAQEGTAPATRPRRVHTPPQPEADPPTTPSAPLKFATRLNGEPVLRVGLSTSARSVTISTTGHLLNASSQSSPSVPLSVARVRVEPRMLAPLPSSPSATPATIDEPLQIQIAGLSSAATAQSVSHDILDLTGDEPTITQDTATNTWRLSIAVSTRAEAEELRARLQEAGYSSATIINASSSSASSARSAPPTVRTTATKVSSITYPAGPPNVRLTAGYRTPEHGLAVYGAGASPLMDAREPVTFATDDETSAPVRFDGKAYRGQLEVFANLHGALTVVNVVGLEDYVRGVVPNELSPGGYPAIEALKAQAVAARTYAVSNRGRFAAEGFDLLPTTRSQVYGGIETEHPLSTRAVEETRGIIATYKGEPINALYTSTCGGRTENAEDIFGGAAVPYLRGRECGGEEGAGSLETFTVRTTRAPLSPREAEHTTSARDVALLAVHNFSLPTLISDAWLDSNITAEEARALLAGIARLAQRTLPVITGDVTRPPGFGTALAAAVDGESRANVLLDKADVDYLLSFRDADEIPAQNRADVALLLRDGHLTLYPDATLRPRQPLTRACAIHAVAHLLESRSLFHLQKATARPSAQNSLIIRAGKSSEQILAVSPDAYLFRAFGENLYGMREVALVGGEPVTYHMNGRGEIDYLEVRPAPNGAASDRFSPFTNWTTAIRPAEATRKLSRYTARTGPIVDLRVVARGSSGRALDLEIVGANGMAHLTGGRIRSALGLREQLFVIDRKYDETGRLTSFVFTGRGWGHGVGMCQVGAYGLARAGWTYNRILKAYYTGIDLTKLY